MKFAGIGSKSSKCPRHLPFIFCIKHFGQIISTLQYLVYVFIHLIGQLKISRHYYHAHPNCQQLSDMPGAIPWDLSLSHLTSVLFKPAHDISFEDDTLGIEGSYQMQN